MSKIITDDPTHFFHEAMGAFIQRVATADEVAKLNGIEFTAADVATFRNATRVFCRLLKPTPLGKLLAPEQEELS